MNATPSPEQEPQRRERSTPAAASSHLGARPVTEIMSHPVLALTGDRLLDEALDALVKFGLRHLAVVDRERRCLGVIADRMIVSAWAHNMSCLHSRRVGELLDPEPATVGRGATITEVARIMGRLGVDAVAVIETNGALAGIVTGSDLVTLLSKDDEPADGPAEEQR